MRDFKFHIKRQFVTTAILFLTFFQGSLVAQKPVLKRTASIEEGKPRVIVLTDISANSGDPDHKQSLVRFLLYSNEFDIEGLIATSACVRSRTNKTGEPSPDEIVSKVKAYGRVLKNLRIL